MAPARTIPLFPSDVAPAHLYEVDFSLLCQGDEKEVQKVFDAARGYGFFYLRNHDIDSDFMFDLASQVFQLPLEEKMKYDMGTTGKYFGYKRSGSQYVDSKGTPDQSEFYNVSKDDILRTDPNAKPLQHPGPVNYHREELEDFMRAGHKVITVVLRVLGEKLGLDADTLPALHRIDRTGGDQARVTFAPPMMDQKAIALGEHTDFGSVTVLFNELGGLQVLNPQSKEWKYVKPEHGCAVINLGDAVVKLTNGQLYSGMHRVVAPPGEQAKYPRHSCVYFARPNGHVILKPLIGEANEDDKSMTADEWIARRVMLRKTANYKGPETLVASRGTEHTKADKETVL